MKFFRNPYALGILAAVIEVCINLAFGDTVIGPFILFFSVGVLMSYYLGERLAVQMKIKMLTTYAFIVAFFAVVFTLARAMSSELSVGTGIAIALAVVIVISLINYAFLTFGSNFGYKQKMKQSGLK